MARGSCGAKGPPPPRTQPCGARGIGVAAARPENPQQNPSKGGYVKVHRRSSCKSVRLRTFVNRRRYWSRPYQGHLFFSHLKVENLTDNMQIANLKVDHLESAQNKKNWKREPNTRFRFCPVQIFTDFPLMYNQGLRRKTQVLTESRSSTLRFPRHMHLGWAVMPGPGYLHP